MLGSIEHDHGLKKMSKILSSFILQGKGMTYMFHQEDLSNLKNFYDYALVQMEMNFRVKYIKMEYNK